MCDVSRPKGVGNEGLERDSASDYPDSSLRQPSKTGDVESYAFNPDSMSDIDWESLPDSVRAAVAELLRSAKPCRHVGMSALDGETATS